MKQLISLTIGCLMAGFAFSQTALPVVKGYAYHQSTARGVKPSAVAGENDTAEKKALLSGKLFIFLEFKKTQNILPFRIWIDGKPYRVQNTPIESLPFIRRYEDVGLMKSDTLVPSTRNHVMQVSAGAPLAKLTIPPVAGLSKNARPGTVVVEYYWRARRYAYTLSEIKILEAVRLQ